jgi:hypothetical protein
MCNRIAVAMREHVRWRLACALPILFAAAFVSPADARDWKPTVKGNALNYSQILDERGGGEIVFVWWLVPLIAEGSPKVQRLLDEYALIALVHAHFSADGTPSFDSVDELQALDAAGNPLVLLHESDMPPSVAGAITTMKSTFRQTLGAMGKGTHWFAFKHGAVRACSKGRLTVQFAGENYTYDTPIPGCPQA